MERRQEIHRAPGVARGGRHATVEGDEAEVWSQLRAEAKVSRSAGRNGGVFLCCCLLASTSAGFVSARVAAQPSASKKPAAPEPAASAVASPPSANHLPVGVGLHYGALLNGRTPNPWRAGLGLELGYTLTQAVYLGVNVEHFFGEGAPAGERMLSSWQLGAETGYDVGLGEHFVLRPKLGLGVAILTTSYNGCNPVSHCSRDNDLEPLAAPGLTFLFLNGHLVLSASVRYALMFSDAARQAAIFSFSIGGR